MNGKKQSYTILKMIFNQNQPFSFWSIKFFNGILVVKIETFWMHAIKQNKTFNGDTNSKECRMVHRNGFFFSHMNHYKHLHGFFKKLLVFYGR